MAHLLSTWCRNNVYFPVFGATRKVWLGLYASMMVMGLWHYVDLNWASWALWHGTGLVVVSFWLGRKKAFRKAHRGEAFWSRTSLRHALLSPLWYVMTFCFVALGYSFVGTPNIATALRVLTGAVAGPFVWIARRARRRGPARAGRGDRGRARRRRGRGAAAAQVAAGRVRLPRAIGFLTERHSPGSAILVGTTRLGHDLGVEVKAKDGAFENLATVNHVTASIKARTMAQPPRPDPDRTS